MIEAKDVKWFRARQAHELLFAPCPPPVRLDDKWALHDYAANHIGPDAVVDYFEVGVAGGQGIRRAAERFRNPDTRLVGFDSFEGLPEDWLHLPKGSFTTGGKIPKVADPRVAFVKGWFQNAIPPWLAETPPRQADAVLIHYDADLYSSTLFALCQFWSRYEEYYFIMDDFMHDDIIALHDFSAAFPVEIEWIAQHAEPGRFPKQPFGRMRRVPFHPVC